MSDFRIGWIVAAALGLAAVALAASLNRHYRRDIADAYARLQTAGAGVAETACGPIEYAAAGDGRPVLVIHGIMGGIDQGLMLAEGHIPSGYRTIAPSRFGYLGSSLPGGASTASQADAFSCLLDELAVERVAVLATSAGATSAIQFALRHPDRCSCLILIAPNAPGEVDVKPPPKPIASAMYRSDFGFWLMTEYFRGMVSSMMGVPKGFELSPDQEAAIDDVIATVLPVKPRADGALFDLFVSNPAVNDLPLKEIAVPTLIVNAIDDPLALYENSRAMADRVPGATLLTIEDGGHMMLGHGEEVRNAVEAFLAKHAAEAP